MAKPITYKTTISKFKEKGEKTGWTYIDIPFEIANQLKPNIKVSYRVKGQIDAVEILPTSILPMGEGNFILPIKKDLFNKIGKIIDEDVTIKLLVEEKEYELNKDFVECLQDVPKAYNHFKTLPKGHQNYFSKWIESAKTKETQIKRIVKAVKFLGMNLGYVEMIRDKSEL